MKKTKKKPIKKVDKRIQRKKSVIPETLAALLVYPTYTETAEKLGISRQALYERIEKYQLKEVLEAIPNHALTLIKTSTVKAAEAFIEQLGSKDVTIKLEAAREILDRAGIKADQKTPGVAVQVNNIVEQASKEADEFIIDATDTN